MWRWKWPFHCSPGIQKPAFRWTESVACSADNPQQKLQQQNDKQKMHYDRNAKPLPSIKEGEIAWIRKWKLWKPATVTAQHAAQDPTWLQHLMALSPDETVVKCSRQTKRLQWSQDNLMIGVSHPQLYPNTQLLSQVLVFSLRTTPLINVALNRHTPIIVIPVVGLSD